MNEELNGIVENMVKSGESEENIALVIQSYQPSDVKKKESTQSFMEAESGENAYQDGGAQSNVATTLTTKATTAKPNQAEKYQKLVERNTQKTNELIQQAYKPTNQIQGIADNLSPAQINKAGFNQSVNQNIVFHADETNNGNSYQKNEELAKKGIESQKKVNRLTKGVELAKKGIDPTSDLSNQDYVEVFDPEKAKYHNERIKASVGIPDKAVEQTEILDKERKGLQIKEDIIKDEFDGISENVIEVLKDNGKYNEYKAQGLNDSQIVQLAVDTHAKNIDNPQYQAIENPIREDLDRLLELGARSNTARQDNINLILGERFKDVKLNQDEADKAQQEVDKEEGYGVARKGSRIFKKIASESAKIVADLPNMAVSFIDNNTGDFAQGAMDKIKDFTLSASMGVEANDKKVDEMNPTKSNKQLSMMSEFVEVNGNKVFVDDNGNATEVRDKNNYKLFDEKEVDKTLETFNSLPKKDVKKLSFGENLGLATNKVGETMIDMASLVGTTAIGGGSRLASMMAINGQMYNGLVEHGIDKGLTREEAENFGFLASNGIALASMFNPMEAKIASNLLNKGVKNEVMAGAELITKGLNGKNYKEMAAKVAKGFVEANKSGAKEGFEESVLEPFAQYLVEKNYDERGKGNFDPSMKQDIETWAVSYGTGAIMGGAEYATRKNDTEAEKNAIYQAILSPEALDNYLASQKSLGLISDDKIEAIKDRIGKVRTDLEGLDVSEADKRELAMLFNKKSVYNEKLKTITNEVVKGKVKEESNQIDLEIEKILNEEPIAEVKEPIVEEKPKEEVVEPTQVKEVKPKVVDFTKLENAQDLAEIEKDNIAEIGQKIANGEKLTRDEKTISNYHKISNALTEQDKQGEVEAQKVSETKVVEEVKQVPEPTKQEIKNLNEEIDSFTEEYNLLVDAVNKEDRRLNTPKSKNEIRLNDIQNKVNNLIEKRNKLEEITNPTPIEEVKPIESETNKEGSVGVVKVKQFAFGDGGTKGIFISSDGTLYKSIQPQSIQQTDKGFERKPIEGQTTNEHALLSELQQNKHIPKIGKIVETSEGAAFEIEKLDEIEKFTPKEHSEIMGILDELNESGFYVGDKVTVMRRPKTGELVVVDFSSGYKASKDARDSQSYMMGIESKMSKSDLAIVRYNRTIQFGVDYFNDFGLLPEIAEPKIKGFQYKMKMRPFGVGAYPKEGFEKFVANGNKKDDGYYAIIEYSKPLSEQDINSYELEYDGQKGEIYDLSKAVEQSLKETTKAETNKEVEPSSIDKGQALGDNKILPNAFNGKTKSGIKFESNGSKITYGTDVNKTTLHNSDIDLEEEIVIRNQIFKTIEATEKFLSEKSTSILSREYKDAEKQLKSSKKQLEIQDEIIIPYAKTLKKLQNESTNPKGLDENIKPSSEGTSEVVGETKPNEQTTEQIEQVKRKTIEEIKSKPLTKVRGLMMRGDQAEGSYISTEEKNRYETEDKKAESVEVEIENPLVVEEDIALIDYRNKVLNENRDKFTREDSNDFGELPKGKLSIDDLNDSGIRKLAKLTTEKLKSEGYDSVYFPQNSRQEGELIVFDRTKVTTKADKPTKKAWNEQKSKVEKAQKRWANAKKSEKQLFLDAYNKENAILNNMDKALGQEASVFNQERTNKKNKEAEARKAKPKPASIYKETLQTLNALFPMDIEAIALDFFLRRGKITKESYSDNGSMKKGSPEYNQLSFLFFSDTGTKIDKYIESLLGSYSVFGDEKKLAEEFVQVLTDNPSLKKLEARAKGKIAEFEGKMKDRELESIARLAEVQAQEELQEDGFYVPTLTEEEYQNIKNQFNDATENSIPTNERGVQKENESKANGNESEGESRISKVGQRIKELNSAITKLEEKIEVAKKSLEKDLKANEQDMFIKDKPKPMFDDFADRQALLDKSKKDLDAKRKELAEQTKLLDELNGRNGGEMDFTPFQKDKEPFKKISSEAFKGLIEKLQKAFPNVKVNLFKSEDVEKILGDSWDKVKKQVEAWHGSPHSFDKFSLDKIGSGEGNQSFGYGLYFTDLKGVAQGYARMRDRLSYKFNFDGEEPPYEIAQIINYIDKTGYVLDIDNIKEALIGYLEDEIDNSTLDEEDVSKLIDFVNSADITENNEKNSRNLYKVSIHKGKQPSEYNWLEWDKPFDQELKKKLKKDALQKVLNINTTGIYQFKQGSKWYKGTKIGDEWRWFDRYDDKVEVDFEKVSEAFEKNFEQEVSGNVSNKNTRLYQSLSEFLEGDKNASLFLLENGIDGIKYPAESIARGATSDNARGFNYVVFDENAVSIEDKVQFMKRPNGEVYGFVKDGQVYLNEDMLNANTPLHEFGHIWENMFPKEFSKGIDILKKSEKGRKLIAKIKQNKGYANLTPSQIEAEALVTAIGNKGDGIFNDNPSLFKKFKEWLGGLFTKISEKLGFEVNADTKFDQFTKGVVKDLLGGKELVGESEQKGGKSVQFSIADVLKRFENENIETFKTKGEQALRDELSKDYEPDEVDEFVSEVKEAIKAEKKETKKIIKTFKDDVENIGANTEDLVREGVKSRKDYKNDLSEDLVKPNDKFVQDYHFEDAKNVLFGMKNDFGANYLKNAYELFEKLAETNIRQDSLHSFGIAIESEIAHIFKGLVENEFNLQRDDLLKIYKKIQKANIERASVGSKVLNATKNLYRDVRMDLMNEILTEAEQLQKDAMLNNYEQFLDEAVEEHEEVEYKEEKIDQPRPSTQTKLEYVKSVADSVLEKAKSVLNKIICK